MKQTRGRVVEVTSLADLDRRVAAGARSMEGWRIIDVDLTGRHELLDSCDVAQSLFLGCTFADDDADTVRRRGGIVFPEIPGVPVDPYRPRLYSPAELFGDDGYHASLDAQAYAWSQRPGSDEDALAMALHDHAIDVALAKWVDARSVAGVMGGHALVRGSAGYAAAAELGRGLGTRLTVATGGGPGAMEAANLGAWASAGPSDQLEDALDRLARVPSFRPSIADWAAVAFEVLGATPGADSLGIPTWHYGHEPPNPFATSIAKFFRNAPREALLLEVCNAGIVFLPGAGGTVQEIFQDACENFYADPSSVAPMVLVGRRYWTEELPAWPLLQTLARGRAMEEHVHLVDTVDEAVAVVTG
ncbi:MAG: LOG family protein [Nocardioides sp.]|nr:LOG family protein [Nocardioides sp.]